MFSHWLAVGSPAWQHCGRGVPDGAVRAGLVCAPTSAGRTASDATGGLWEETNYRLHIIQYKGMHITVSNISQEMKVVV